MTTYIDVEKQVVVDGQECDIDCDFLFKTDKLFESICTLTKMIQPLKTKGLLTALRCKKCIELYNEVKTK